LKELELNLAPHEGICCVSANFGQEFFVQNLTRHGHLLCLQGVTNEDRFEQLVFSPNNIIFRFFQKEASKPIKKIGFAIEAD
jgi:hypothetical protein